MKEGQRVCEREREKEREVSKDAKETNLLSSIIHWK
jgi:hypothetical protein